jgi:hypothetical protein
MVNPDGIEAPSISPGVKLYGPVSYFPSIEKTYGEPMQHWIDIVDVALAAGEPHMKVVDLLKSEHGMGHGHANAVVGWVKQQRG